jgi:hypothetical protein
LAWLWVTATGTLTGHSELNPGALPARRGSDVGRPVDEIAGGTINKVMAKSDLELGIEALHRDGPI